MATPRHIPQARFTDAILAELSQRAPAFDRPAETLYLGGGTPSLWDPRELDRLLHAVHDTPGLIDGAEITLEANPNEITAERMATLMALGITRISLGVQSFQDDLLAAIDRRHGGAQAREACELIARAQFDSHSIDLIFGLPGQDTKRWDDDLSIAIAMAPPHLSVYGLTVEPRTVLRRQVEQGRVQLPNDDVQMDMMLSARDRLQNAGYSHYEVSSYATPGHRARHNSAYWTGKPYIGLGPGAHGFLPPIRWKNIRRPSRYISTALDGDPTAEQERLDVATLSYERVMTGLRDLEHGVDFEQDWERYQSAIRRQVDLGHLVLNGTRARLTDSGLRLMNVVLLDLL